MPIDGANRKYSATEKNKKDKTVAHYIPRKAIENTTCGSSFEEGHWRSENGKCHTLMKFPRCLRGARLAFVATLHNARTRFLVGQPYLDRTEYPQDQGLDNHESGRSNTKGKVYTNVLADISVDAKFVIGLSPAFKPYTATCEKSVKWICVQDK